MIARKVYPDSAVRLDRYELPYVVVDGYAMYVSPCCNAAVSIFTDDGVTYCKSCYEEVDPDLGGIPEL